MVNIGAIIMLIMIIGLFFLCGPILAIVFYYVNKKSIKNVQNQIYKLNSRIQKVESIFEKKQEGVDVDSATRAKEPAQQEKMVQKPIPAQQVHKEVPKPVETKSIKDKDESLEFKFGRTWINRIGIVAIIFAIGYFLIYAFENNLIGPAERIIIGIISGLVLLFLGIYNSKKYPIFSQGFIGGGIAALYFTIFAAFHYYEFIGQSVAFALLTLITISAAVISLRYKAWSIMLLGIVSAYITPFMISTGEYNDVFFLSYYAVLNLGIFITSIFRKWRFLNYISFFATNLIFVYWLGDRFIFFNDLRDKVIQFTLAEIFVNVYFITFFAVSIFYNILKKKTMFKLDITLIILTAAVYFSQNYYIINSLYEDYLGLFTVLVALVYFATAYLTARMYNAQKVVGGVLFGISLVFVTLAIPIQLDGNWITLSWAIEGLVLAYISFAYKYPKARIGAGIIMIITTLRLIAIDFSGITAIEDADFLPMLNTNSIIFLLSVLSLFGYAYVYKKFINKIENSFDKDVVFVTSIVSNILLIMLLMANAGVFLERNAIFAGVENIENIIGFVHSAILIVYSMIVVTAGIIYKKKYLRVFALVVFIVAILKVFIFDISMIDTVYRILSFIVLGIVLISVSFMYQKFENAISGGVKNEDK